MNELCGLCWLLLVLHAWNSGESLYSRPSELVSPRRE